jgi:hypothetical protein
VCCELFDSLGSFCGAICVAVISPGLPLSINVDEVEFLGSLTTPSGIPTEENAYVLNLAETGGYIDGRALLDPDGRRLDENPSACGHLLNHNVDQANVRVVSFLWKDLLEGTPAVDSKEYFSLPNVVRSDGALRYRLGSEMVYYHNKDSPACAGAVFCATTNIKTGQEFFLDYGLLQRPLPSWASDWYEKE